MVNPMLKEGLIRRILAKKTQKLVVGRLLNAADPSNGVSKRVILLKSVCFLWEYGKFCNKSAYSDIFHVFFSENACTFWKCYNFAKWQGTKNEHFCEIC